MINHWIKYSLQVISLIAVIYINYLANALPINGISTGDVSDMFVNKLVPANFTFAIWGFIYLALIGYLIYYASSLIKKRLSDLFEFEQLAPWFILSNILNGAWMFSWHHLRVGLALCLMVGFLICLGIIFHKLQQRIQLSMWPELAFESYFAWINVATVANASAFLVSIGWNGFGINQDYIASLVLMILIAIGTFATIRSKSIAYPAVLAWAMFGISCKIETSTDMYFLTILPIIGYMIFLFIIFFFLLKDFFKTSDARSEV